MLNPQLLANTTKKSVLNARPTVERMINEAAREGKTEVEFPWEQYPKESKFVDMYRDDRDIFPEALEICFDAEGIKVSWDKLM